MFLMLGFVIGFSTGLSIYTGQRFGARDEQGVRRSAAACAVLSLFASIVLTAVGVLLCRQLSYGCRHRRKSSTERTPSSA